MSLIEFSKIASYSEKVNDLDEDQIQNLIDQFAGQQPFIMAYLMAVHFEELEEEERELLFYLGFKVWYTYTQSRQTLALVKEEILDNAEMDNDDMLHYLSEESEEGFQNFAEQMMEHHPQGDLLQFVLIGLLEDEESPDENVVYADNLGLMFIALKTVIDSLHKVSPT